MPKIVENGVVKEISQEEALNLQKKAEQQGLAATPITPAGAQAVGATPDEAKIGHIYRIGCKLSDKVYIGQTLKSPEARLKQHIIRARLSDRTSALHVAIRKYGAENFFVELIEQVPASQLDDREIYHINLARSVAPLGYNLHKGGRTTELHVESINKIKAKLAGRTFSESTINKMRRAASGRVQTYMASYKQANRAKAKSLIAYTDDESIYFSSHHDVCTWFGVNNASGVYKAVRGEQVTYKGYKWAEADAWLK
jgi:group I intron endonuclease